MTRVSLLVYGALLALLALTCALARVDLGALNLPASLLIAIVKAALVGAFFMKLRERPGLLLIGAVVGPLWLAILISFVLSDVLSRGWLALPG